MEKDVVGYKAYLLDLWPVIFDIVAIPREHDLFELACKVMLSSNHGQSRLLRYPPHDHRGSGF
jgi:hypothetical protein